MAAQTTMPPAPAPMTPRQREGSLIRWVYMERYELHAHTKEKAILTLRQHGFLQIDESKLRHGRTTRPVPPMSTDFELQVQAAAKKLVEEGKVK